MARHARAPLPRPPPAHALTVEVSSSMFRAFWRSPSSGSVSCGRERTRVRMGGPERATCPHARRAPPPCGRMPAQPCVHGPRGLAGPGARHAGSARMGLRPRPRPRAWPCAGPTPSSSSSVTHEVELAAGHERADDGVVAGDLQLPQQLVAVRHGWRTGLAGRWCGRAGLLRRAQLCGRRALAVRPCARKRSVMDGLAQGPQGQGQRCAA